MSKTIGYQSTKFVQGYITIDQPIFDIINMIYLIIITYSKNKLFDKVLADVEMLFTSSLEFRQGHLHIMWTRGVVHHI